MAAGVHLPLVAGRVRKTGCFRNIKSVHIGTEAYGRRTSLAPLDGCHNARTGNAPMNIEAEGEQSFGHVIGRLLFRKAVSGQAWSARRHFVISSVIAPILSWTAIVCLLVIP